MPEEGAAQGIMDIFSSFITDEISDLILTIYYTNPIFRRKDAGMIHNMKKEILTLHKNRQNIHTMMTQGDEIRT
ncbi:MAG: hypothetical protein ACLTCI_07580 [[Clostridium] nexile]